MSGIVTAEPKTERGQWVHKREFILSCLGYAVGIGNVWRFPYLCYRNGGGAFLVPYLLMLFLCGLPLYFMETSIGQFSSIGCISMFRISPIFKGAGLAIMIVNILCTSYYSLILTYPLLFIVNSFGKTLPWENCDNAWNTELCMKLTDENEIDQDWVRNSSITTPADEFFQTKILEISSSINELGTIVWPIFWGNAFSWIFMFACIAKGVKSVGKVVYFTATFPFLVLFVLFFRGITLPGAMDGIAFYMSPQWSQLTRPSVWADAAMQIFYSLGPGWGGIINMASYNKFKNNNLSDSLLIPIINCGTSIFAGFVVFSVIGFMSHRTGLPVSTVATGGPSLAFVTYPAAIAMLPWPNLWAILFFTMLFFLGIDSCFVTLETIVSAITDEIPCLLKQRTLVAFIACFIFFLISTICTTNAGMYIVQLVDWYAASITVIMICFIEVVIVGWTYGCDNFVKDVEFMIGKKVHWVWPLCWKYITPTILALMFVTSIVGNAGVTYMGRKFPEWCEGAGWSLCVASLIFIPSYMMYHLIFCETGSFLERLKNSISPRSSWRPADTDDAAQWQTFTNKETLVELKN